MRPALCPPLVLMLAVWCVLLAGQAVTAWVDLPWAVLLSFSGASALVFFFRPAGGVRPSPGPSSRTKIAVLTLGLAAGCALHPARLELASFIGSALGIEPEPTGVPPLSGGPTMWISLIVLAPVFEETLYRSSLFFPLRARIGAPLAIVVTSALFAAPHVAPWIVLGTFLGGLLLGTAMHLTRSLALCIAIHVGQNLAVVAGLAVSDHVVPPAPTFVTGLALLSVAAWLVRRKSKGAFQAEPPEAAISTPVSALAAAVSATLAFAVIGTIPNVPLLTSWDRPSHPFDDERSPAAPDYSRPDAWAARPDRLDFSDIAPPAVAPRTPSEARADVFFIHPTTYFAREGWNQPLDDEKAKEFLDKLVLANQASAFNSCCRVFAPRYRQVTVGAFLLDGEESEKAREVAYGDIRSAFAHYLDTDNGGRPVIVAAHSQGSYHALRLLEEEFSGKALREELVAAYLIGIPIPLERIARTLPDIPLCASSDATGCLVTWNTAGPKTDPVRLERSARTLFGGAAEGRGGRSIACVNPLTWAADASYAPARLNLGGVVFVQELERPGEPRPGAADAQCVNGILVVREIGDESFERGRGWSGDYHLLDYGFFYMNIRANAKERAQAFLDERARRESPARIDTPASPAPAQAS